MRQIWIISYDIVCNKRRYRLDKSLAQYGQRIQYSIYQVILNTDEFSRLRKNIKQIINAQEDKVNYYRICRWCQNKTVLQGKAALSPTAGYTCIC